ncbi:ABC transporter substrate-binding protein [Xanthobacter dioxanivorans]|uniref:ABC transporter substrate-binding protein n=1 Tax=Xanthobacter dioxanivorans TaxID=2528964 RepID=A0A974PPL5_9HYPH|nr:ABC transporter substrate-binding protein [Xanthobacter dioxanivorans]QRG06800.1 ABC transporter substrate-binding protein [Xanthobacter dioxanivorans]
MKTHMVKLGALLAAVALALPAVAHSEENGQFIPVLSYRTGPFAPNGIPWANGIVDYFELINQRDGGINGVKIIYEECETGYATDRGVECYERLKNKGPTGAAFVNPLSTGITFALTEKAPVDKIPLITAGFGRSESKDGSVFTWNFPLIGTYWTAADVAVQHIAKELGGPDKLKGRKIILLYHDSPFGKEPILVLEALAKKYGFQLTLIPVANPGVEQKSQWLQIRQLRPDYVVMWGWGVMNPTAIQEAANVNFPREKMIGFWFAGAEPDVIPAGTQAIGYKALMLQHGAGRARVHDDLDKYVYGRGLGKSNPTDSSGVLFNRGMVGAMLGVEGIRTAMAKFGNKPLTGEEVRWGIEHLTLDEERLKELGFDGMISPIKITCSDHEGTHTSRVQQWDGKQWKVISDWYTADETLLKPMLKDAAGRYAKEKGITPRDCGKES